MFSLCHSYTTHRSSQHLQMLLSAFIFCSLGEWVLVHFWCLLIAYLKIQDDWLMEDVLIAGTSELRYAGDPVQAF